MSDSETALLARIAALEAELSGHRKQRTAIPSDVRNTILRDPVAALEQMGVLEAVSKAVVAKAVGPNAPHYQNIMTSARTDANAVLVDSLLEEINSLRQRVDTVDSKARLGETKGALHKAAADKTKYPHLASALAADSELFDSEVSSHRGSADELAQAIEARLSREAKALGIKTPPASQGNADNATTTATSTQAKAQTASTMAGDPPPIPRSHSGPNFTEVDQKALRDEIVRNVERGVYSAATPPQ